MSKQEPPEWFRAIADWVGFDPGLDCPYCWAFKHPDEPFPEGGRVCKQCDDEAWLEAHPEYDV